MRATATLIDMTTYVKLVKGATKIKMAPPKPKYVDPILLGTGDPEEFHEIIRALDARVQDTAWTVVYKSFIVVHLMIREGEPDVTIAYLSKHLEFFRLKDIFNSKLSSGDLQALKRYREYLQCRCEQYARTHKDYVRDGNANLKGNVKDAKLALDHVESLEAQITALIKNRYSQYDLGNDLLMCAFRLLVQDLLVLYNSLNEGIITLLESFFELTHANAERTLELYKRFVELTENVVKYLKTGKAVGLKIPVIKHITTKLIRSLEEHLREDSKKGQTFSSEDKTPAQKQLEQVREQKRQLEEQLKSQQQVTFSPTIPQQQTGYNPFSEGFTFEQPLVAQQTSNPFAQQQQQVATGQVQQVPTQNVMPIQPQLTQLQPQVTQPIQPQVTQQFQQQQPQQLQPQQTQQLQPQQTQFVPVQHTAQQPFDTQQLQQQPTQQIAPPQPYQAQPQVTPAAPENSSQLQTQQTGFFSSNTQLTPSFTGAGFGGYSAPPSQLPTAAVTGAQSGYQAIPQPQMQAQVQPQAQPQVPAPTGSNNPFSLDNISRENEARAQVNPFSQINYTGAAPANPFSQQQPTQSTAMQQPHTFGGYENIPTVPVFPQAHAHAQQQGQQQYQMQPSQQQINPFSQPQQQQFQQAQPRYGEGPNLIDI